MRAVKNPRYFDADLVGIDELTFLPIVNGSTTVHLYRAGTITAMPGLSFPPLFTPLVGDKKDFHREPAFATVSPAVSALRPPLDNVLLRYALNMATEKRAFADVLGAGQRPALNLVPPMAGYRSPTTLPVAIDGHNYDVPSFEVEGARALVEKAGFGAGKKNPEIAYHFPALPETKKDNRNTRCAGVISRRAMLRGAGVGLALPLLNAMSTAARAIPKPAASHVRHLQ